MSVPCQLSESGQLGTCITVMRPFAAQQALLVTIPGEDALTAAMVAEIGVDMSAFGTAQRLAAWAGLCPANDESAGKQKRRGTRKGNPYLKAALVTTAISAARTKKGRGLHDKFHRLRARMGAKKAAVAIAHKLLVAPFHTLQRAVAFADPGAGYLDHVDKHRTAKRPVRPSTHPATPSCSAPSRQAEPAMAPQHPGPGPPA